MSVEDADIPFITEVDEVSSRNCSSHGYSLQPTPSHSRSPSFREDHFLLDRKKSSSLEELRRASISSATSYHHHHYYQQHRKTSSRRSRRSQCDDHESRKSLRRGSVRSSRSSTPNFAVGEDGRRRSVHIPQNRRHSSTRHRKASLEISLQQRAKERRRRKIVYTVVSTFLFILLLCVLAVVVTLTHQSEFSLANKTTVYYTFAPHPKLITPGHGVANVEDQVRKENEELMNSLSREPQSFPNTSSPVPD